MDTAEHLPFNAAQHMHLEHYVRLWLQAIKDADGGSREQMHRAIDFVASLDRFMHARDEENLLRG